MKHMQIVVRFECEDPDVLECLMCLGQNDAGIGHEAERVVFLVRIIRSRPFESESEGLGSIVGGAKDMHLHPCE